MMKHEYDIIIAEHYAAYRPPLHHLILKKCLKEHLGPKKFNLGLDVGCGTGQSSVALTDFCEKVIAIDPSPEMLVMAKPNRLISYKSFDGKNIELPKDYFDIVTFAGSLFYAKSQRLFDETLRVIKNDGIILIYDFEIVVVEFYRHLKLDNNATIGDYDHWADFSGLDTYGITKLKTRKELLKIKFSAENLAHVILAEQGVYHAITSKYPDQEPYKMVCDILENRNSDELQVNVFYTMYRSQK
jgi:ubiquinone/menaquinone biosynthesis C-methylase UbiE